MRKSPRSKIVGAVVGQSNLLPELAFFATSNVATGANYHPSAALKAGQLMESLNWSLCNAKQTKYRHFCFNSANP
jgi:hypothetical protein